MLRKIFCSVTAGNQLQSPRMDTIWYGLPFFRLHQAPCPACSTPDSTLQYLTFSHPLLTGHTLPGVAFAVRPPSTIWERTNHPMLNERRRRYSEVSRMQCNERLGRRLPMERQKQLRPGHATVPSAINPRHKFERTGDHR